MPEEKDRTCVGYGHPPIATRFQSGRSGNPSGRPKSRKSFFNELLEELAETIVVEQDGRQLEITNARAIAKGLVGTAVAGDMRAVTLLVNFCAKASADATEAQDSQAPDSEILAEFVDRELRRRANKSDVIPETEPIKQNERNSDDP